MFREIISGLLIVLLLFAGFISYVILFEIEEVESPSVSINLSEYETTTDLNKEEFINNLTTPFENSVDKQKEFYKTQTNKTFEYNDLTRQIIFNKNMVLITEYNSELREKQIEINEILSFYENKVNKDKENKIAYYTEIINKEYNNSISNLLENYHTDLNAYTKEINKQYSNEILNLRLKLTVLELTDKQRKEYQDKLNQINIEKSLLINGKKEQFTSLLMLEQDNLKSLRDQKINTYSKKVLTESNELIAEKKEELNTIFDVYHKQQYKTLEEEIMNSELEVLSELSSVFKKRDNIIKLVKEDLEKLIKQYDTERESEI